MQTGSSSKYVLAYDADCRPCTKFKCIVDILDIYEKIDFISLIEADQEGLLDKIPVHQRYKSFHLIFPKGEAKSGSEALLELIAILPGGKIISPKINNFPGGKKTVRFIYKRFSRLHDRGSCSIHERHNKKTAKLLTAASTIYFGCCYGQVTDLSPFV